MNKFLKTNYSSAFEKILLAAFGIILALSLFLLATSSLERLGPFPSNLFKGVITSFNENTSGGFRPSPNETLFTASFNIITMPITALLLIVFSIFLLRKKLLIFFPLGLIGGLTILLYDTLSQIQLIDGLILPWIIFLTLATLYLIWKNFFKTIIPDSTKKLMFIPQLSLILLTLTGLYLIIVYYSIGGFSFWLLSISFPDARNLLQSSDPNKILIIGTYDKQTNEYNVSNPNSSGNPFLEDFPITLQPK